MYLVHGNVSSVPEYPLYNALRRCTVLPSNSQVMTSARNADSRQPNLHILPCTEPELPHLFSIQYAACEDYPFHLAIWGPNTLANRAAAAERLLTKWRANRETMCVVKCVLSKPGHVDDSAASANVTERSNDEQITIAWCIWSIYTHPQTREQALAGDSMNDCCWLSDIPMPTATDTPHPYPGVSPRALGRSYLIPSLQARWNILHGRSHAYLTNLVTDPRYRGMGAGTVLVEWGIREAEKRAEGVCYMEASELGKGVYHRLGFKEVGSVKSVVHVEVEEGGENDGNHARRKEKQTREVLVDESPVLVRGML